MTFILLHAVSSSGLHAYNPALTLFLLEKCFSSLFNQYSSNSGHLCLSCPILSSIKDHWHNWHHTRSLLGFGLHYLIGFGGIYLPVLL